ncbi:MAG: hypothetical protein ACI4QT_06510 [Kiritimatiellia bacterium]
MSSLKSTINLVHFFEILVEWIANTIEDISSTCIQTLDTIRKRWTAPFFQPDILIVADPLAPSCAVIASGLARACQLVAVQQRKFRIWIATVPGTTFEIRFHTIKKQITVSANPEKTEQAEKIPSSSNRVPRLNGGKSPAILTLDAHGESIRLELQPSSRGIQWIVR